MSLPEYDVGDSRRIIATFTDIDGNLADPTTITFEIKQPDETTTQYVYVTDPEVVRDSLGVFHVDWPLAQKGLHIFRYEGTGAVEAAGQYKIWAKRSI